ncbi:CGNR zinc finger domain-containing protein [Thermomonospora echinospora]|uniref:CGNR zinc finger domain-containing protein n=1 Tax=Thermomonospora echinospora TaxID=1992 RepID=UPI001F2A7BCA|nr:CGNR zinc finger domain-containing protein [Thermomonospora echinospora]
MTGSDAALLLRDFVNTLDMDSSTDALAAPDGLGRWLAEHGLPASGSPAPGEEELAIAVALREGLRAAMLGHHGSGAEDVPAQLQDVLALLPLRVALTPAGPALVPACGGALGALAGLAAAITDAAADGSWRRLKVCPQDTCRWAFLDTSKNRSRTWCSMRVCGNRTKTRAYRARRRSGTP